jgi:hypothetical protein
MLRMTGDREAPSGDGPEFEVPRETRDAARAVRVAGILLLTGGCLASVMTQWESPVRAGLALLFLFVAPGLAVAEAIDASGLAHRMTIATGGSLALETLLAVTLVYAGLFSVRLAIAMLAAFTVVVVALALVRSRVREDAVVGRSVDAT